MDTLDLPYIYDRCLEETQKYRLRQKQDDRFCFELLRRAFNDTQTAWMYAYSYCVRICRVFLYTHPNISHIDESLDTLCNDIITRIWQVKRGQFGDFDNLPAFLQYLKRTTHNYLIDLQRNQSRQLDVDIDLFPDEHFVMEAPEANNEFWEYLFSSVRTIARDKDELRRYPILMELKYRYGYKNQEIVENYPELWSDTNTIRVDRQRIFRHLQNDERLEQWLE